MHELLRDTYRQVADVHSESPREEHSFGSIPVASDLAPSVRVSSTPAVAPTPAIGLEDILGERHERERDTQRRVQRRQRGIGDLYERGVNAMRKRDELVEVQRREQEERETAHPFAPQLCAKQLQEVLALRSRPHTVRYIAPGVSEGDIEGEVEAWGPGWSKSKYMPRVVAAKNK